VSSSDTNSVSFLGFSFSMVNLAAARFEEQTSKPDAVHALGFSLLWQRSLLSRRKVKKKWPT